jgi:hypothetical protein
MEHAGQISNNTSHSHVTKQRDNTSHSHIIKPITTRRCQQLWHIARPRVSFENKHGRIGIDQSRRAQKRLVTTIQNIYGSSTTVKCYSSTVWSQSSKIGRSVSEFALSTSSQLRIEQTRTTNKRQTIPAAQKLRFDKDPLPPGTVDSRA